MKTVRLLLRFEFRLLLFALALAAFLKPVLLPPANPTPHGVLLSFFVPWAALIALLFLMAHGRPHTPDERAR